MRCLLICGSVILFCTCIYLKKLLHGFFWFDLLKVMQISNSLENIPAF